MASPSLAKQSPAPMREPATNFAQYPAPLARYEDVVASPKLFMSTLEKFHASMGTKFMIPIIGGKDLDLHQLFVEVTSRGGIEKIIRERKWKEVTAVFNFPSTATNASFVLRKYYGSLLHHYEQLYYFKNRSWTPVSPVPSRTPLATQVPARVIVQPSPEYQAATAQQTRTNTAELCGVAVRPASSAISPVIGVIDGKFDGGYLVTVTIGSEKLKGVLYQAPQDQSSQVPQYSSIPANQSLGVRTAAGSQRRRRRKKHEIKRRDPAHPKPNRSGYNFFFAEQHARLKPLHPGKDREISRMIGELWNKLKENEKAVYQETALKDKERYRVEMEDYRERLRTGRVVSNAVPLQQWEPEHDSDMVEADGNNEETEGGESHQTMENETTSSGSGSDDNRSAEKEMDVELSNAVGASTDSGDVCMATSFELSKKRENDGVKKVGNMGSENSETPVTGKNRESMSLILGLGTQSVGTSAETCVGKATVEPAKEDENAENHTETEQVPVNHASLQPPSGDLNS